MKKILQRGAVYAGASLVAAAAVTGCSGSGGGNGDTITIGSLQPLSGSLAAYGQESEAGFEFVVDKINSAGGIKSMGGAKIELKVADGGSDPSKAANEARRLVGQEGASMIVGSLLTSQMAAVSPIADQLKVPVLSEFAGGSNSKYLYSLGLPYAAGYAETFAEFLEYLNTEEHAGIKTAALASSDYEAGQQVDKGLKSRLPAKGIKVIGDVPLETGGNNYQPAVTKLDSTHPDVVTGLVTTEDGITLHRARATVGSKLLFVGGTGGYADQNVWNSLGPKVAAQTLAKNSFAMTTFSPDLRIGGLQQLLKNANEAKLDVPIGQNFVQGAQAARVLQRVLEAAGSDSAEQILKAFSKVNIQPDSPDLYMARPDGITFDPSTRFMKNPRAIMVQWNADGTQDVIWPQELAAHKPELKR